MDFSEVKKSIQQSNKSGETLSPFLFLWNNLEILHSEMEALLSEVLSEYNIPATSVIKLEDNGENLKIESIRQLLQSAVVAANYQFQVFVIENISRLTLASSNSMLKFLEEPGKRNIIFLSNASESGVLETILSRVSTIQRNITVSSNENLFFKELLSNVQGTAGKQSLLSYVYGAKLEKSEYIDFLQVLLGQRNIISPNQMLELSEDIQAVANNNVLPKYVLDKWVMKII